MFSHTHTPFRRRSDLKPENVLLVQQRGGMEIAKITDFGLATILQPFQMARTLCGTPQYVAPEILVQAKADPSTASGYGNAVDLWSLGAILYVMLSGNPAFDHSRRDLFDLILTGSYSFPPEVWGTISCEATELVHNLLVVDPAMRITADRALSNPWCYRALQRLKAEGSTLAEMAAKELAEQPPPPGALCPPFALPSAKRVDKLSDGTSPKRPKTSDGGDL
jgi:serine/threonine protein kinase